jgi:hypothetical protein
MEMFILMNNKLRLDLRYRYIKEFDLLCRVCLKCCIFAMEMPHCDEYST